MSDAEHVAQGWAPRRVEHFQPAALAAPQPVAGPDLADRHAVPVDGLPQRGDRLVVLLEHHRRDVNHAHGEPVQQARQGVEVVQIGVGEHDGVEVP